jgi:hypothetical protein
MAIARTRSCRVCIGRVEGSSEFTFLEADEAGDDLQIVLDPVVDLPEQDILLSEGSIEASKNFG